MEDPKKSDQEPDLDGLIHAVGLLDSDPLHAEQELKVLAEKGSVNSMLHLGHLYWVRSPELGGADLIQSENWFLSAYKIGSIEATFYLGRLYLKKTEFAKAREVFQAGAERGYAPSIFHLGRMYKDGMGVDKRRDIACTLFERASALGHISSKRYLGLLFLSGRFGFSNIFKGLELVMQSSKECVAETERNPASIRLLV